MDRFYTEINGKSALSRISTTQHDKNGLHISSELMMNVLKEIAVYTIIPPLLSATLLEELVVQKTIGPQPPQNYSGNPHLPLASSHQTWNMTFQIVYINKT